MIRAVLALTLLWVAASGATPPQFTGDAAQDFALPGAVTLADPGAVDVGVPLAFPAGTVSGMDIEAVHLYLDIDSDTLYVGIATYGVAGDADGDGKPDHTGTVLAEQGGIDTAKFGETEFFGLALDLDEDGSPEVVAGVANGQDLSAFGTFRFDGPLQAPALAFGDPLPAHTGPLFLAPNAKKPHLEFTIPGFSSLSAYAPGDTQPSFAVFAFMGSLQDVGIGEDFLPSFDETLTVCLDADQDGMSTCDGDCDDTAAACTTVCQDVDADLTVDCLDPCIDRDGDGYGVGEGCDGPDCDDTSVQCVGACEDRDGDLISDCDDPCIDQDGDGFGQGPGCVAPDCDDRAGTCTTDCADTDGDGQANCIDFDDDNDGLLDLDEAAAGTDPLRADTDRGGVNDGDEIAHGQDPLDPSDDVGARYVGGGFSGHCGASGHPASRGVGLAIFVVLALLLWRSRRVGLLILLLTSAAPLARAQNVGLNLQHFTVQPETDRIFWLDGTQMARSFEPTAGLFVHFTDDPLRLIAQDGGETQVVDSQLYGDLAIALGILGRGEVQLSLPVTLLGRSDGGPFEAAGQAGMGDLGLRGRFQIIRRGEDTLGFGLAASLGLQIPLGASDTLHTDNGVSITTRAAGSFGAGPWLAIANLGLRLRTDPAPVANLAGSHELTYGAGLRYRFWEALDLGAELVGRVSLVQADEANAPLELQSGPRWRFTNGWSLEGGLGLGLVSGYGVPDWRAFLGAQYAIPEAVPPAPDLDADDDGILDTEDACPHRAEDGDWFEDYDGCPDLDNDKDGIPDERDTCPGSPEDRDGFEDQDGCPDPDNDHDGIIDSADKCPDDAENVNGVEDADGCPDQARVKVQKDRIVILDKVHFDVDAATIRPESHTILAQVASVLAAHSRIARVEVQGHTDDTGEDAYNMDLSTRRARAVADYLVALGVSRRRLTAKGFGESKPLIASITDAARATNRRVEFHILSRKNSATNGPSAGTPGDTAK